jgi:hypothetical protein
MEKPALIHSALGAVHCVEVGDSVSDASEAHVTTIFRFDVRGTSTLKMEVVRSSEMSVNLSDYMPSHPGRWYTSQLPH